MKEAKRIIEDSDNIDSTFEDKNKLVHFVMIASKNKLFEHPLSPNQLAFTEKVKHVVLNESESLRISTLAAIIQSSNDKNVF